MYMYTVLSATSLLRSFIGFYCIRVLLAIKSHCFFYSLIVQSVVCNGKLAVACKFSRGLLSSGLAIVGFHEILSELSEEFEFLRFQILLLIILVLFLKTCSSSVQQIGKLNRGFKGSQMYFIDNDGLFLVSNNSNFGFGFTTTPTDVTLFLLVVIHKMSSTIIWTANRGSTIRNSDNFQFDTSGNAYLLSGGSTIWSTNTANRGVSAMELQDSGNLVLVGDDDSVIWQSFSHPTDTLVSNQEFSEGMKLVSDPGSNNLSYSLEIKSGDMILSANFKPPQPYWSMSSDTRITINKDGGQVSSAVVTANSWKFYDPNKVLLWQFIFSDGGAAAAAADNNSTWAASLGSDGYITFTMLLDSSPTQSSTRIPQDECSRPAACDPYYACYPGNKCQCPSGFPSCKSVAAPPSCGGGDLVSGGEGLGYFALKFVRPFSSKTTLASCKASCLGNCSCGAMFFDPTSGNCFLFNEIGSMVGSSAGYASYIKVSTTGSGGGSGGKHFPVVVVVIVILTVLVISGLLFAGFHFFFKKNKKLNEGKIRDIIDAKMRVEEEDERVGIAIKVALWCVQDDMYLRPPMTKVVQMLEGLSQVPPPPTASQLGLKLYSSFFRSLSEEGTSSGPSDCNSDAYLSAVRLSGPR
ncbi:serine/threonine-protein kinase [Striga asiatica]|uniref:Serine/threonine-protein kinase n=1 Tax=Striga asiatica TaxID=4170 RepID=A0A5A7PHH2_STRAF|nr:serine/threonine-protein kinase [Striga asiatica]